MKTVQREKRVICAEPHDIDAAAVDGPWISMENYQHASIHVICGVVGGDFNITLQQAQDSSGTGAKALAFDEIYQADNSDATATERDKFTSVAVASNSHTVANATDDSFHLMIELDSAQLDRNNNFKFFRVRFSDPGAATFACAVAELKEANYVGTENNKDIFPSALA